MSDHGHQPDGASSAAKPLMLAIVITASFTLIELVGGLLSDSLALMSDAGHMLTDTLALALSLAAVKVAMRPPNEEKTFGFLRAEILAALVNGSTLILISGLVFYESFRRILEPPEIEAPLMLVVAILGLGANAGGLFLLRDRSKGSLNIRGVFLHMMGDLLSSVAVIAGAVLILLFGLRIADPVLSMVIGAIILYGAWKLVTQSTSILLESVPSHIKLDDVRKSLLGVEGIVEVHDLHIWTLSSGLHAMSAHVVMQDSLVSLCSDAVHRCEQMLKEKYMISHTTFQIECQTCGDNSCIFQPVTR